MRRIFDQHPIRLFIGLVVGLTVFGALAKPLVELIAPWLSIMGVRVTINWLFVSLVIVLVAWLGWWGKTRITAPLAPGSRRYVLPLVALIVAPLVTAIVVVPDWFAVPDWTFVGDQPLPPLGVAAMVVIGIALGAAVSEELLYRGVVLRSLESYGRLKAALASSVLFGVAHLSLLAVGEPVTEVLVIAGLSMIASVGLAAITFRLGTLWPLVLWHFLQDCAPAFLTPSAIEVYSVVYLVLALGISVAGAWWLWTDRNRPLSTDEVVPDGTMS